MGLLMMTSWAECDREWERKSERDMCITNDPSLVELMMTVRLLPVHAAAPCPVPCGNPL